MTETKKRIQELKALLPNVRERVISVALLLALSVTMMASASYAWYTLSFAPEATEITTTVSSNGSLEVALAGLYDDDGNLREPFTSAIGDSFSADGQTTVSANLTWGNLINLSNNYGIESLVLRPATLDLVGSNAFLSSKVYSDDGRVETSMTDFGFTKWSVADTQLGTYDFLYTAAQYYGVRAISSLIYPDGKGELETKLSILDQMRGDVITEYTRIYCDDDYIKTIQSIVQVYLDANVAALTDENATLTDVDCTEFVPNLHLMLDDFYENAVCAYGDILAYMATIQTGTTYTRETLSRVNANDVVLSGLSDYLTKLEKVVEEACEDMDAIAVRYDDGETITWDDLEDIIFALIDINTVQITIAGKTKTVTQWMNDKTTLASAIIGLKEVPVYLNSGAFWQFERQCGAYMYIEFKLNIMGMSKPTAKMTTTAAAAGQPLFVADKDSTKTKGGTVAPSNKVAADTYGMVLDLWVRTNAVDSILTLDGLARYTETKVPRYVQIVVYDENNNPTTESKPVYFYNTYTVEKIEGIEIEKATEHLVYADVDTDDIDSDGDTTETIYRNTSSRAVAYITETVDGEEAARLVTESDVEVKYDIEINVNGFESSNRVDESYEGMLYEGEISTTQGSGSCYIFYSSNPEEADNTLKMLSYLKLAFVDGNNNWLADAKLNVQYAYNDNGKYIVPVVITDSNCTYTAKDGADKETEFYGITELNQNEATLISVVVYLEGSGVDNSMVLSGETVTGKLNIQFASTLDIDSMFNTDLAMQYLSLSALINGELSAKFDYDGTPKTAELVATIDGISANSDVQAIFRRRISSTQGSSMDPVALTYQEGKGWVANPQFTMPGDYVLSGLWINGVEYSFPVVDGKVSEVVVTVEGFALQSVMMYGSALAFTADNSTTREVGVTFSVDKTLQPSSVSARFLSDTGEYVTAPMYWNGSEWKGMATFRYSGNYTLTYLVLDGEYYELDEQYQRTLTAYLGLYTEVTLVHPIVSVDDEIATEDETGDVEDTGETDRTDEEEVITSKLYTNRNLSFVFQRPEKVGFMVNVYTNDGQKLEGLENLYLAYADQKNPSFPEQGLVPRLTWDGTCYYGEFMVGSASSYYFAYVRIGDSETIRKATQAPTINAAYPDPPEFAGSDTEELIITGNNLADGITTYPTKAVYQVTVKYGPGYSNVVAIFENAHGEQRRVTAYEAGESSLGSEYTVYKFEFPTVTHGDNTTDQNGTWTVVGFEFYDVYGVGGFYHAAQGEENAVPYPVDIAEADRSTYTVVQAITVDPESIVLGVDADGKTTGAFMEDYTYSELSGITFAPIATDVALDPAWISSMTMTLIHNGDTSTYGGYTVTESDDVADILEDYRNLTFTLTDSDGDGVFTVVGDDATNKVYLAGTYKYTLTVKMTTGATYTFGGAKLLTVKSVTPSATITAITPTGSNPTRITYTLKTLSWGRGTEPTFTAGTPITSTFDQGENKATVYAVATADNDSQRHGSFTRPTLTITVAGIDSGCTASLILPGGSADEIVFSRTGNGIIKKTLGKVEQITSWTSNFIYTHTLSAYYGHGEQKIETMTIVKSGVTFTVTLEKPVVINNPSSVNQ